MENQQEPVPILQLPLDPLEQNNIASPLAVVDAENNNNVASVSSNNNNNLATIARTSPELATGSASTTVRLIEQKPRRTRSKWSEEETRDLIKGCGIHGVGNWKK